MASARDIGQLEALLGHSFANLQLLHTAMTHCSYANEVKKEKLEDNERLEFLGDAVLDLLIGHDLMQRFPELSEGQLSMTRAQMVSEVGLCKVASDLKLGDWLLLGKGEEKSGGRSKPSILSDAMEAMVAALYLDAGFEVTKEIIVAMFRPYTPQTKGMGSDHKTRLQVLAQSKYKTAPVYQIVEETGPAHDRRFEVAVLILGEERARATGHSKKAAEQLAASYAVVSLSAPQK